MFVSEQNELHHAILVKYLSQLRLSSSIRHSFPVVDNIHSKSKHLYVRHLYENHLRWPMRIKLSWKGVCSSGNRQIVDQISVT